MVFLRWSLLLPGAIAALMIGSVAGGMAASLFGLLGQAVADTGGAFAGAFAFVFACCLLAPSHRRKVGLVAASLMGFLALGTVLLSNFTEIEEFVRLSARERLVTPVAQALGALYALFIALPVLSAGAILEDLWRQIMALGVLVFVLGAFLVISGIALGLFGLGWLSFHVGLTTTVIGILTWLFPIFHIFFRLKYVKAKMAEINDR